jgi:hypothetical protein
MPPPGGEDLAERLNEYFRREGGGSLGGTL